MLSEVSVHTNANRTANSIAWPDEFVYASGRNLINGNKVSFYDSFIHAISSKKVGERTVTVVGLDDGKLGVENGSDRSEFKVDDLALTVVDVCEQGERVIAANVSTGYFEMQLNDSV